MSVDKTQSVQKKYNRFAPFFNIMEGHMASGAFGKYKQEIWRRARGKVLEVGVGTGANFPYYTKDVQVTGIDFSERMLAKAQERKQTQNVDAELMFMDAQNMTFPDNTFDTVVTTCVFCTVPDAVRGLKEVRRVCKPEGKVYMLEHVRSAKPVLGTVMDWLNPIIYGLVGTHINRDTVKNLQEAGLKVISVKQLMGDILLEITASPNK